MNGDLHAGRVARAEQHTNRRLHPRQRAVMAQTGHRSMDMLRCYIREARAETGKRVLPEPMTQRTLRLRPRANMNPLALGPEQAQQLHWLAAVAIEPVRYPRVELGRLARS